MREMIDAANANAQTIRDEIASVAEAVGYVATDELNAAMNGRYANYYNAFEGIASVNAVLNSIYDNVNAMARAAGAVKAYAAGGLVDYTGLASVHGTPGKPELMLNASDTERFLEAAQILRENQLQAALSRKIDTGFIGLDGFGNSIGPIDFHVDIDHVLDYNDFVKQLQADPKFEKLIDTMTMGRMLGNSRFAKNSIQF